MKLSLGLLLFSITLLMSSSRAVAQNYIDTTLFENDPLLLDEVLISDNHGAQKLLNSSSSAAQRRLSRDANSLESIATLPGIFIDNSLGDVYSRVFARGVTASAEDDIGWFYTALQEDGLPLTAVQYNYFTPDFFRRNDLFDDQVEAIIGGKSGILGQNSPGGIINFTSRNAVSSRSHTEARISVGQQGEGRLYHKSELYLNDWVTGGWHYNLGGHYRYDEGHRNTDYPWSQGGQLRLGIAKVFAKGILQINAKYLDDHTNRHTGLAATNWDNPTAAFDQDFNNTALMLPEFDGFVGDDTNGYAFNPANGIHIKNTDLGLQYDGTLTDIISIQYKGKYSQKSLDWQTSFSNSPLGLDDFLPYFISGDEFPVGTVSFSDAQSGQELAVIDNQGILAQFQGQPGSFEYLSGSLPNDAVMGIAAWKKADQLNEIINDLKLNLELASHQISLGVFHSISNLDYYSNASYAYTTFENQPRMLQVSLTDFYGNTRQLSDDQGLSNYGGLFYEQGSFDINQFAFSANDQWQLTDLSLLDFGMRYESISHQGTQILGQPIEQEGGLDGNTATSYDNGFLADQGISQDLDFRYSYASGSIGLSHLITDNTSLFSRYSIVNKAPELNYYIQNFSGAAIDSAGAVQEIDQLELGFKHRSKALSISLTAFSSKLSNIAVSDFFFDQQSSELFYLPVQVNSTNSNGLELQWSVNLSDRLSLLGNQTFQSSEAETYTVYSAAGTSDSTDDEIIDYSDNQLPHQPNIMSNIALNYSHKKLKASLTWQYMGRRYGNIENSFELPAFSTFALSAEYDLTKWLKLSISAQNILNDDGLMNFFGPNTFGGGANDATAEYIDQNPNASFVVFPILPRSIKFSVYYRMP